MACVKYGILTSNRIITSTVLRLIELKILLEFEDEFILE